MRDIMEPNNQPGSEVNTALVVPDVNAAAKSMELFTELKTKILTGDNDIVHIKGRPFITRQGWRKIALAFNITTEIIGTAPIHNPERVSETLGYVIQVRAVAKNGRFAVEIAACEKSEFKDPKEATTHNIITKATTRAVNRAISDLVGGGEISAEELENGDEQGPELPANEKPGSVTPEQLKYIDDLMTSRGIDDITPILKKNFNGKEFLKLTKREASSLIDLLKLRPKIKADVEVKSDV